MLMLRGLWKLTWLEIKIFLREPLGVLGTIGVPLIVFLLLGRLVGGRAAGARADVATLAVGVPVFAAVLITVSAVLSMIAIIAIYREGGILKRLRATPLRPHTILIAHVLVKLLLTGLSLGAMLLAGRYYYPVPLGAPIVSFAVALLFATTSILSTGFLIASVVPTARFAQPLGSLILYPMLAISGLFVPVEGLPPPVQPIARAMPVTYAVSLLKGIWTGEPWSAHIVDVAVLMLVLVLCSLVSARVFRWE